MSGTVRRQLVSGIGARLSWEAVPLTGMQSASGKRQTAHLGVRSCFVILLPSGDYCKAHRSSSTDSVGLVAGRWTPWVPTCPWRSYLVDPASSHMLVSKIKPCMSKHKPLHGEAANGSLGHPWFIRLYNPTWITVVILELIHASKLRPLGGRARLLDQDQPRPRARTFGDSG